MVLGERFLLLRMMDLGVFKTKFSSVLPRRFHRSGEIMVEEHQLCDSSLHDFHLHRVVEFGCNLQLTYGAC